MTKDWLPHKDIIIHLYKSEGNSLDVVKSIMYREYGFDASIRAFRSWLQKWRVTKYTRNPRKRRATIEPLPVTTPKRETVIKTEDVPGPILQSPLRSVPVKHEPMEPYMSPPSPEAQKPLPGHGTMSYPQNTNGILTPPARYFDRCENSCSASGDGSGAYYGQNGEDNIGSYGLFSVSHQNGGMQAAHFPIRPSFGGPTQDAYPNGPLLMPPRDVFHNYESQFTQTENCRPCVSYFPQGPVTPPKQNQHFTAQKKSPTMAPLPPSHIPAVSSAADSYVPRNSGNLGILPEDVARRPPINRGSPRNGTMEAFPNRATVSVLLHDPSRRDSGLHESGNSVSRVLGPLPRVEPSMENSPYASQCSHQQRPYQNRKPLGYDQEYGSHGKNQSRELQYQQHILSPI